MNEYRKHIFNYIQDNCIYVSDNGIDGKSPGSKMKWMFMLRRLTHNPEMLQCVSIELLKNIMEDIKAYKGSPTKIQMGGLETASIPLMIGMSMFVAGAHGLAINTFSVRKERKRYGIYHYIDGIPNAFPVILVDDLINSGGSIRKAIDVINYELQLPVFPVVYSIVKFAANAVWYQDNEYTIKALFNHKDFDLETERSWLPKDVEKNINKRPDYR